MKKKINMVKHISFMRGEKKQEHTYQVRSGPVSKAENESACLYKVDFIVVLFPNYLGRSSLHTEKYSSELL